MSLATPRYVGIDLGTTNSAAAVFDGEQVTPIRNAQGATLTPSVVRIDSRGNVTVGARARRYLERDSNNTRGEFKRLMGTSQAISFKASSLTKTPEELSAEVLKSLRKDIEDQFGFVPERAVISVPALFELPQNAATSEAARLAGFEQVELLQEPIASALAAGWSAEEATGSWLVYDLGGGTFDASLLETRDGLLRVIGHDGDNFLGGRDFDWAIVDWILAEIKRLEDVVISRSEPTHGPAITRLKQLAEEAKIELSRATSTVISVIELAVPDGDPIDLELPLSRDTLEALCMSLVDRSLDVCTRLTETHGLKPGDLQHVVLVGGPSVMPIVRRRVSQVLQVTPTEGLDPMSLVARGAAIYAATAGLDARPAIKAEPIARGQRVWLQHPAMSSDITPHVVGKLVDSEPDEAPKELRVIRSDGLWESPWTEIDEEGAFVLSVTLLPRRPNIFRIEGRRGPESPVAIEPPTFTIVQGLTISDPPLSRTVGVALANNHVRVYFERGAPLPVRRTFNLRTVETIPAGSDECLLKIPIVQGEFEDAHLCRLVGSLELRGETIKQNLPAGSEVEVTIELDRGGRMSARALVPSLDQVFEQVAHLLVPEASPEVLVASLEATQKRVIELRSEAFQNKVISAIGRLNSIEARLASLETDVSAAAGGDTDAAQKARRAFLDLDAEIEQIELEKRWPKLDEEARETMIWASAVIADFGLPHEARLLTETAKAIEHARKTHDALEMQRQLRLLTRLASTASLRHPHAWHHRFERAASKIDQATDLVAAQALVKEGKIALNKDDVPTLRRITQKLWQLLPDDPEDRRLGHDSGVR